VSGLRDGVGRPAGVELTVVIAAFDAEATLGAQLDALAAQRAPFAWELVVADNGSTDGTAALARSYGDRLPVRVVDASATRGAGAARNVGVSVARAPLVAFCDADDVVGDGWLAAMRAALRTHAFVAGRFEGARLNGPRVLRSRTIPQTTGLQESTLLPGLHAAGAGNMGIRADVFRAVGGFDPGCLFLEDTDLCWRVQLAGVPLTWAPEAVLHVRLRGTLRSTLQQGYHYGSGEHWLALRYREQQGRLRALAAGRGAVAGAGAGAVAGASAGSGAGAAVAVPAAPAHPHRGWRRALHRLRLTVGALARVRSVAELGAWCWELGFGLGFAFARLETPSPVAVARLAPGAAAAVALPPGDRTVPA
jgi:GT2 family glycosyltransferase